MAPRLAVRCMSEGLRSESLAVGVGQRPCLAMLLSITSPPVCALCIVALNDWPPLASPARGVGHLAICPKPLQWLPRPPGVAS